MNKVYQFVQELYVYETRIRAAYQTKEECHELANSDTLTCNKRARVDTRELCKQ